MPSDDPAARRRTRQVQQSSRGWRPTTRNRSGMRSPNLSVEPAWASVRGRPAIKGLTGTMGTWEYGRLSDVTAIDPCDPDYRHAGGHAALACSSHNGPTALDAGTGARVRAERCGRPPGIAGGGVHDGA